MTVESNSILIVGREDLLRCDTLHVPVADPQSGEVLLRIETFGLSTNNITYLALGDALPYRKFFPVPDESRADDWVCPPVWGVAKVIESNSALLSVGDSVYGFYPAARYATLMPAQSTAGGFRVERPHIPDKLAFYHLYGVLGRDPYYLPDQEEMMVVMRPLFLTGLLLDDYLREAAGADRVVVSSAASKTAFGFASAFRRTGGGELIGLASVASLAAAESFGLYDRVLLYEQVDRLETDRPVVYADISGSVAVRQRMQEHLADELKLIVSVGLTHWTDGMYGSDAGVDGARSEVFFAPGWSARRIREKGQAFLGALRDGWTEQMKSAGRHFTVARESGIDAAQSSWRSFAQGRIDPSRALVHDL